jgi:hypothetical protein
MTATPKGAIQINAIPAHAQAIHHLRPQHWKMARVLRCHALPGRHPL